jgi:hypothetical protein
VKKHREGFYPCRVQEEWLEGVGRARVYSLTLPWSNYKKVQTASLEWTFWLVFNSLQWRKYATVGARIRALSF